MIYLQKSVSALNGQPLRWKVAKEKDDMNRKLKELKEILAEVADLVGAQAVLGWDQQTYMPAWRF